MRHIIVEDYADSISYKKSVWLVIRINYSRRKSMKMGSFSYLWTIELDVVNIITTLIYKTFLKV